MPKITVQRSTIINSSPDTVFAVLNNFNEWVKWSPWLLMEPEAQVTIADDNKSYEWSGDRLGSGNMKVLNELKSEFIEFNLNFIKPWKSTNTTTFKLNEVESGTEVIWTMNSRLPFFLFWMRKMMKAFISSDYDRGLSMLKEYVETGEIKSRLEFAGQSKCEPVQWIGINTSCSFETISTQMETDYAMLDAYTREKEDIASGAPFTIYRKWDMVRSQVDYIACIPVKDLPMDLPPHFTSGAIPEIKVHKIRHIGSYHHLGNAWSTGQAMIRNKEFKHHKKIYPFEVYQNDPKHTPEKELITEVHFPLR